MRKYLTIALLLLSASAIAGSDYAREKKWADEITPAIVVGDPIYLKQANGHEFLGIYTEAAGARMGVVVAHGLGIHPDWGLIGTLRQSLAEHGYTTLSIQLPILASDAKPGEYAATFPDAAERLQLAVALLQQKGYKRIALVSHSMGSRMAHAYMAGNPPLVGAWAALGNAATGYAGIAAPVLDLYGARDLPQVLADATARRASLSGKTASRQTVIADADHFYARHEKDMVAAVVEFLDSIK